MWSESPVWHSSDFLRKRSPSSVFLSESESSNTSNSCLFLKESCSNSSWNITDYRKFKKLTIYKLSYGYDISLLNSVWHVCLLMIAVLDFGDVCPQVSAFKLLSIEILVIYLYLFLSRKSIPLTGNRAQTFLKPASCGNAVRLGGMARPSKVAKVASILHLIQILILRSVALFLSRK